APSARTRMTEGPFADAMAAPEDGFDKMHPGNVSPVVAWFASEESADVSGRIFEVEGWRICLEEGWNHGPARDAGRRWDAAELGPVVRELIAEGVAPEAVYGT